MAEDAVKLKVRPASTAPTPLSIASKAMVVALLLSSGNVVALDFNNSSAAAGSRCEPISVDERPRLGDRTRGFDWTPYTKAHDRYLRRRPEVFASGYLSGRHFYVGFTRRVCHHLQRIRHMVDTQRWRFRAFIADYSLRQLRRAQRCVGDLVHREWLGISAWGPDVWRNKLWVMLRKRTDRRERFIRRECPAVAIRFSEGEVEPDT